MNARGLCEAHWRCSKPVDFGCFDAPGPAVATTLTQGTSLHAREWCGSKAPEKQNVMRGEWDAQWTPSTLQPVDSRLSETIDGADHISTGCH
jgi:hypothetical protein